VGLTVTLAVSSRSATVLASISSATVLSGVKKSVCDETTAGVVNMIMTQMRAAILLIQITDKGTMFGSKLE